MTLLWVIPYVLVEAANFHRKRILWLGVRPAFLGLYLFLNRHMALTSKLDVLCFQPSGLTCY